MRRTTCHIINIGLVEINVVLHNMDTKSFKHSVVYTVTVIVFMICVNKTQIHISAYCVSHVSL